MNRTFRDLTGKTFGYLTVINKEGSNNHKKVLWRCICVCGNETIVVGSSMTNGLTTSCGCKRDEAVREANKTHGLTETRLYSIWKNMKKRCYNKNNKDYKYYGGQGVTLCDYWKNEFINFYNWSINNGYKENLTIDRKDNYDNYNPLNCRWVTMREQNLNKKSNQIKREVL